MYCSHCGKQIDDGVSFCPECGAKVGAPTEQPKQDAPRVYCKNCGREVSPDAALCPNCGAKIEPQNKKPINALGIAGFVLSLISLWGGSVFVVPIVGLILSAIGVAQREKYSSSGFATAGLVISIHARLLGAHGRAHRYGRRHGLFRRLLPRRLSLGNRRLLTKQENGPFGSVFFCPFLQAGR